MMFVMFDRDNDKFPLITDDVSKIFMDERSFEKHLLDQGFWFWRQFGIKTPIKNPVNNCPDLLSSVNMKGKHPPKFNIEVEYAAKNFIAHKHQTHNVHLIISFKATLGYFSVKGVPVVSYYRKCPDGMLRLSLEDDIGVIFHGRESSLLRAYGGYVSDEE